jgi:hypothetical protein
MTPDPLPRATRVRKARRSSRVSCGHYVLTGQAIVRRGGQWACLPCALAATPANVPAAQGSGAAQEGTR